MPNKVERILNLEKPSDVKGVRSFLGLTGYYRRFIPKYAHRPLPLTTLTRKNARWQWNEEQENACRELKSALSKVPILRPHSGVSCGSLIVTPVIQLWERCCHRKS